MLSYLNFPKTRKLLIQVVVLVYLPHWTIHLYLSHPIATITIEDMNKGRTFPDAKILKEIYNQVEVYFDSMFISHNLTCKAE